jgi:hypothetical protein
MLMILSMSPRILVEGEREKRTASTAVAPGGPAERHLKEVVFMGASPQTPGLAALELERREACRRGKMEGREFSARWLTGHLQDAKQNPTLPRPLRALQAERKRRSRRTVTLRT